MSEKRKSRIYKLIPNTVIKIWEGFLQNIGVFICAFILSGGYLVALNKVKAFQKWVREVPTDWVLTPFVLVLILLAVFIVISYKQKKRIVKLEREPLKDERDVRFVTHYGLWWRLYFDSEYIEDFPYCTCCNPKIKLAQIEWYPDEIYECPNTKAQFKLFDEIPRKRSDVLNGLYETYFRGFGRRFSEEFSGEYHRLKELGPDISEEELFKKLFQMPPLNKIPKEELAKIRHSYPNPRRAFSFLDRHFSKYKHYFRQKAE